MYFSIIHMFSIPAHFFQKGNKSNILRKPDILFKQLCFSPRIWMLKIKYSKLNFLKFYFDN